MDVTVSQPGARRRMRIATVIVVLAAVVVAAFAYAEFFKTAPAPAFASDEDYFLYGSMGTEETEGLPYWIWLVLPRIFPEYLPSPGGYGAVGVLGADGREMPIGFSKVRIGVERVGVNCALCHTGSYRLRADEPRTIVPTAPAHQFAPQLYLKFLSDCASDPRFNADVILQEIAKNYSLSLADRIAYRFFIIPSTRRTLLARRAALAWSNNRPAWGHGRMDLVDAMRFGPLRQPVNASVATSDLPPIWNLGAHAGTARFWDGANTSLDQIVRASALGGDLDPAKLARVQRYISNIKPPAYPLPIDRALAVQGAPVFQAQCGSCHAPNGDRAGTPIPIAEVRTDPRRAQAWTADTSARLNDILLPDGTKLSGFRSTGGYVAVSLDGIWLRAPYLHNGSVPSLDDLLKPPAERPTVFWRGYDVFDPVAVGFVSRGDAAERNGTRIDTTQPGNGNGGHDYGTTLSPADKRALLEYLKTL